MKILITGARGLVGRAVKAECRRANDIVIPLAHEELDITDAFAVSSVLTAEKPDAVINCAAYTDVDGSESKKDLCYAVNKEGVANLARASRKTDCSFVTISTDYVFDGEKEGFYVESDNPGPISVYGSAKLSGERAAVSNYERSVVVRTGWIFGHGGTNFLSVLGNLLSAGKEVSAIGDAFGTPTYAKDLAKRLRELVLLDHPGVYHAANSGEGSSYAGFASVAASLLGVSSELVREVPSNTLVRAAPRPRNSRLDCPAARESGLSDLPDWKISLTDYFGK